MLRKCAKIGTFSENLRFWLWALRRGHRCHDCIHFYPLRGRAYGFCDRCRPDALETLGHWPFRSCQAWPCCHWAPSFPPRKAAPLRPKGAPRAAGEGDA